MAAEAGACNINGEKKRLRIFFTVMSNKYKNQIFLEAKNTRMQLIQVNRVGRSISRRPRAIVKVSKYFVF